MNSIAAHIYARLDELHISYAKIEHAAVFTMQDCAPGEEALHAVTPKNCFLTTKRQNAYYLCLLSPNARFNSSDISHQIASTRLHFGAEEDLERLLRVRPGAVSPMGLIFDSNNEVELLVDCALKNTERLAFHPCDNTQTLAMSTADFFDVFLPAVGHMPRFVEAHDFV